ncbi:skin secretory protein xP2-like [Homarus americanus]|uniref:skin secretory protein xP2-like n=1 Tax=Homarus americanus TaxID=6706 RepID=UPI001C438174|nr:skin secretory protein xP2-like [Homarus americanus]
MAIAPCKAAGGTTVPGRAPRSTTSPGRAPGVAFAPGRAPMGATAPEKVPGGANAPGKVSVGHAYPKRAQGGAQAGPLGSPSPLRRVSESANASGRSSGIAVASRRYPGGVEPSESRWRSHLPWKSPCGAAAPVRASSVPGRSPGDSLAPDRAPAESGKASASPDRAVGVAPTYGKAPEGAAAPGKDPGSDDALGRASVVAVTFKDSSWGHGRPWEGLLRRDSPCH